MKELLIHPHERLDNLQTKNNLHLIQNPKWFCFGVDAVLLSHFASQTIKANGISAPYQKRSLIK